MFRESTEVAKYKTTPEEDVSIWDKEIKVPETLNNQGGSVKTLNQIFSKTNEVLGPSLLILFEDPHIDFYDLIEYSPLNSEGTVTFKPKGAAIRTSLWDHIVKLSSNLNINTIAEVLKNMDISFPYKLNTKTKVAALARIIFPLIANKQRLKDLTELCGSGRYLSNNQFKDYITFHLL